MRIDEEVMIYYSKRNVNRIKVIMALLGQGAIRCKIIIIKNAWKKCQILIICAVICLMKTKKYE